MEIEKILNFSEIYCPFIKIITMMNNRVKRLILNSHPSESDIIFEKMREFKQKYYFLESNVNRIIKFFLICKQKNMTRKYALSIKFLRNKFPDDIVINIIENFESNNDYIIKYLLYKMDIDIIMEHCGLNMNNLKYVFDIYLKNYKDCVATITEIINNYNIDDNNYYNYLLNEDL